MNTTTPLAFLEEPRKKVRNPLAKKTKAPHQASNWVTYFGRAKKKMRVIYQIEFYARNKSRTCYASLKRLAQDCACSVDTVYDAIALAVEYGIITKVKHTTVFRIHPLTKKPLFNNYILLTWLGDTQQTAGEEVFGQASVFFASLPPVVSPVKNPVHIKYKESSLKEKKERVLFAVFSKLKEDLSAYPQARLIELRDRLKENYRGKEHFLAVDLDRHIERFKDKNPLKNCLGCKAIHFDSGCYCKACWEVYKQKEKEEALVRKKEWQASGEKLNPTLKELIDKWQTLG